MTIYIFLRKWFPLGIGAIFVLALTLSPNQALEAMTGDQDLDAVFAERDATNQVCLGDGAGGLSCSHVSADANATSDVELRDLDNDGKLDAVFANNIQPNRVCLGDGAGGFSSCSNVSADTYNTTGVELGDVNNDQKLDAVFANASVTVNEPNRVCLGDGAGSFSCSDVSTDPARRTFGMALGDVNNDQKLDAVFANYAQRNWVCLGDGAGSFSCSDVSTDTSTSQGVALGDVNNDQSLDAVFAGDAFSPNRVCLGDGAGGFSCSNPVGFDGDSYDVALGDVNNDQKLDAVFANIDECCPSLSLNRVCLGDGAGGFSCSDVSSDLNDSFGVRLGDVDKDGDLDAVFANLGQRDRVCLGNGAGGFSCSDVNSNTKNSLGVALGHLNGSPASQSQLIFWNKLGSTIEIQSSEAGPNGAITQTIGFAPVQHGDGVALKSGTPQVKFDKPFGTSFPDEGTIEFWWKPARDENSSTGSHFDERNAVMISSDARRSNNFPELRIILMSHSGNYQNRTRIAFLPPDPTTAINLDYDVDYVAGQLIHVAVTWDKTLGTSPVKSYFDGVEGTVVADFSANPELVIDEIQQKLQNASYAYDMELLKRSKRPDGAQNQFDIEQYVDNLKIYTCAKTDFSDRFQEDSEIGCHARVTIKGLATTSPGVTYRIQLAGENLRDLAAAELALQFDPSILEFQEVTRASGLSGFQSMASATGAAVRIALVGTSGISGNAPILDATFRVVGPSGSRTSITMGSLKAFDAAENEVTVSPSAPLQLQVIRPSRGDINQDLVLDVSDSLRALRGIVGLIVLSDSEKAAGDVSPIRQDGTCGDGVLDIADVVLLLKAIVGMEDLTRCGG